jgi:hypothetical protein
VFLINSRLGRFSAAHIGLTRKGLTYYGLPFSQSYGDILPSSLTETHSSA